MDLTAINPNALSVAVSNYSTTLAIRTRAAYLDSIVASQFVTLSVASGKLQCNRK